VSDIRSRSPFDIRRAGLGIGGWIVALIVAPGILGLYNQGLAVTVGINAILAMGLILLTGLAGQFSLAQAAFFGLGAYGSALLTVNYGWSAISALAASAAAAVVVALVIGKPIFRLRGHYLAMGTLALAEIFYQLANNLEFTGRASGFGGIQSFSILGYDFIDLRAQFWLVWGIVGVALWGSLRLSAGREGRALRAVKGHEAAAASCGINVSWSKTRIFAASALLGSVAGSVYAHQILYVNPPPFGTSVSINILAIAVLGGLGSPWGAIAGAIAFQLITQVIESTLPSIFGESAVGAGESLAFGIILVAVLLLRPDGIAGVFGSVSRLVKHRLATRNAADIVPEDEPVHVDVAGLPKTPVSDTIVLQSSGLGKAFGGVVAVHGVDLVLHEREILAVIGPNGAGKSTLQNLLSGNLSPTTGTVTLRGEKITGLPAHAVARRGVARTFQTPSLFAEMTVRENVLIGAYVRGKVGLVRSALPTLGAVREERAMGDQVDAILVQLGLDRLADQQAGELSLGQQKMVELARAFARRPDVLLLDEPGAGLNKMEKQNLALALKELQAEGLSLILIEHDMEFVMSLADRVHVLDFGETLKVGLPAEVQDDPAVIAAYLGVESAEEIPEEVSIHEHA
jgi:ABC-type branched-subunit amino acid transport system ATPase component/ABC-type branched-subunit amino acid transport system permease subunit